MKTKICGNLNNSNIRAYATLDIDFVGFILYPPSKRFVKKDNLRELLQTAQACNLQSVGVFVDETEETIMETLKIFPFNFIQLHGKETPETCAKLAQTAKIVKAFNMEKSFNFESLKAYEPACEFFLFDAKGVLPGGNNITFDWQILENYQLKTPFFLSGGIRPGIAKHIMDINHPSLYGIDLNSGFEIEPGKKDVEAIEQFIEEIKSLKK